MSNTRNSSKNSEDKDKPVRVEFYIYKPGTYLTLINPDIKVKVVSVSISEENIIQYLVEWWSGRDRKTEYFYHSDLAIIEPKQTSSVGFKVV